jgi:hypothetical protein
MAMTRKQAEAKGWKISKVMSTGAYAAKKGIRLEIASTLKALLNKL